MPEDKLLDYFIAHSDRRFDEVHKKVDTMHGDFSKSLDGIQEDMKKLMHFRFFALGACAAIGFVSSLVVRIFESLLK